MSDRYPAEIYRFEVSCGARAVERTGSYAHALRQFKTAVMHNEASSVWAVPREGGEVRLVATWPAQSAA